MLACSDQWLQLLSFGVKVMIAAVFFTVALLLRAGGGEDRGLQRWAESRMVSASR